MEPLEIQPIHISLDSNAQALAILLEIGKVTSKGFEITFKRCFESYHEDRILR